MTINIKKYITMLEQRLAASRAAKLAKQQEEEKIAQEQQKESIKTVDYFKKQIDKKFVRFDEVQDHLEESKKLDGFNPSKNEEFLLEIAKYAAEKSPHAFEGFITNFVKFPSITKMGIEELIKKRKRQLAFNSVDKTIATLSERIKKAMSVEGGKALLLFLQDDQPLWVAKYLVKHLGIFSNSVLNKWVEALKDHKINADTFLVYFKYVVKKADFMPHEQLVILELISSKLLPHKALRILLMERKFYSCSVEMSAKVLKGFENGTLTTLNTSPTGWLDLLFSTSSDLRKAALINKSVYKCWRKAIKKNSTYHFGEFFTAVFAGVFEPSALKGLVEMVPEALTIAFATVAVENVDIMPYFKQYMNVCGELRPQTEDMLLVIFKNNQEILMPYMDRVHQAS